MSREPALNYDSLGADLRSVRKSRGITLVDLAEKLDKSVGWISQVERDISHPSIEDLRGLATALNVPISLFFGQGEAPAREIGRVVRSGARRKIGGGEIGLVEELLSPDLTDDFEVIRSVFKPDAELERAVKRPTQEVGYVVSGKLSIWIGDELYELSAGDSFRIKNEAFRGFNPHDTEAIVVWVISPPIY